ncbi:hypothetical protein tpqmel_0546 [Candidatus Gastranaerophilus sp. (ex Termes propinquus)]|nr:hypothetical protein tpqmel_0546 [Candidatus Gastranaerophilus sp. (ex Termes propinquus)]
MKIISSDLISKVNRVVNCKLDNNVADTLVDKVRKHAPNMIDANGFVKNAGPLKTLGEALIKPFINTAHYATKGLLKLFPDNLTLKNWNIKTDTSHKIYERAARGIQQYGAEFVKKAQGKPLLDDCGEVCADICGAATNGFYDKLAKNLAYDKANYNGVTERVGTRLVTSMIPALFLGFDFWNKAIRDGATLEEASQEAAKKREQEVIAGIGEAGAQYVVLSGLPNFVNNSKMAAPALNTGIGVFFNVASRMVKGMPLTRIKIENTPAFLGLAKTPSMQEFMEYAKKPVGTAFKGIPNNPTQEPEKQKSRLLSWKNLGLVCAGSIAVGMGLKLGKPKFAKTKAGEFFAEATKPLKKWWKGATREELWVSKEDLEPFYDKLIKTGNKKMFRHYEDILDKTFKNKELVKDGKILLGEFNKTFNIGKLQIRRKNLYTIPLAPLKLAKEILSYPYKGVEKLLEVTGNGVLKKTAQNPDKYKKLTGFFKAFQPKETAPDPLNGVLHFFGDFKKHAKMFKDKPEQEFIDFWKARLEKNVLNTLDREGNSKIDNTQLGKITQLLGTFGSIYFAMIDDYNRTAKRTKNKEQAERDARERGVNKFMRITSQIVLIDIFNGVFKLPYAQSLLGAWGVSAACTVATEKVSRGLSSMPSKEINSKEELEAHKENQRNGTFGWYHKAIEKLSD